MQVPGLILMVFLLACRNGQSPSGEGGSGSGQVSFLPSSAALSDGLFAEPELEIIATGLDVPWGMDLLPDGQLLVAERNGRITRINLSTGKQTELARRPALDQGEGGLLGLVLDPEFGSRDAAGTAGGNGSGGAAGSGAAGAPHPYLYVYETVAEGNRIVRMRLEGDDLREDRVLLSGIPKARYHNGGVIRFGPDGYLYAGTGDGRDPFSAQDPASLAGKVLRMTRDGGAVGGAGSGGDAGSSAGQASAGGSAAGGGPRTGSGGPANGSGASGGQASAAATASPTPASLVYSLGHRNIQGLAWDADGNLYATEHGPSGEINGWCCHDEVNRIVQGGNYGWPHVIGDQTREGCIPPLAHSGQDTWAPGGCGVLGGGGLAGTGSVGSSSGVATVSSLAPSTLLVAGLRGQNLQLFDLKTGKTRAIWFQDRLGRLRNVLVGPDGSVYFCSSNRDGRGRPQDGDDKIYRIKPGANSPHPGAISPD